MELQQSKLGSLSENLNPPQSITHITINTTQQKNVTRTVKTGLKVKKLKG